MRTFELALETEARKARWHRTKLCVDVWLQTALYVFVWCSLFLGDPLHAFYAHFFGLGFYQLFSSMAHPVNKAYGAERKQYDKWLIAHLLAFVPCMFLVLPLFIFMLTASLLALFYFYITICEFNHYTR
jgi:hypothetical protein